MKIKSIVGILPGRGPASVVSLHAFKHMMAGGRLADVPFTDTYEIRTIAADLY